jgi:hypothetical protein
MGLEERLPISASLTRGLTVGWQKRPFGKGIKVKWVSLLSARVVLFTLDAFIKGLLEIQCRSLLFGRY